MNPDQLLDSLAAPYTREPEFPINEIDLIASIRNQARDSALHHDTVTNYAAAMRRGDQFPPVILWRPEPTRKAVTISGNHRIQAHINNKDSTIDAFVTWCDEPTARRITFEDNARHGQPPAMHERLAHAVHLIAVDDITQREAAAIVGVHEMTVSTELTVRRGAARAAKAGIRTWDTITYANRTKLARIKNDDVFVAAVHHAIKHRPPAKELQQLTSTVRKADSAAGLAAVAAADERAVEAAAMRSDENRRSKALAATQALLDFCRHTPADIAADVEFPHQAGRIRDLLTDAGRHIIAVDQAVQRHQQDNAW